MNLRPTTRINPIQIWLISSGRSVFLRLTQRPLLLSSTSSMPYLSRNRFLLLGFIFSLSLSPPPHFVTALLWYSTIIPPSYLLWPYVLSFPHSFFSFRPQVDQPQHSINYYNDFIFPSNNPQSLKYDWVSPCWRQSKNNPQAVSQAVRVFYYWVIFGRRDITTERLTKPKLRGLHFWQTQETKVSYSMKPWTKSTLALLRKRSTWMLLRTTLLNNEISWVMRI